MSNKDKKTADMAVKKTNASSTKKNQNPSFKRYRIYITAIIIAGIIGFIIALIKFYGPEKIQRNASIAIEFTYDGASKNLTPSGEQFSIDDIYKDRVLNAALEEAGLADRYTPDDIKNSLVINGSYPSDVIEQIKEYDSLYNFSESRSVSIDNYYPTIYGISLYDDFDSSISDDALNNLVKAIANQYKIFFRNEYIYAYDESSEDELLIVSKYDYTQRVKILKQRLRFLEDYSKEMFELDTSFRIDGKSFNDIMLKCREIENDSLSKAEASIMMDVLTTSSSRLKNQYEYEIKLLENEKTYKTVNLEEINSLIESYETDSILYITAGDSMVKVDSNSKETYETLTDTKRELSDRLVVIDSEITKYTEYLNDLKKSIYSSSSKGKQIAEELKVIEGLVNEQRDVFKSMTEAYNAKIISEDAVLVENNRLNVAKLLSGNFIKMAVKCAAPICIVVMILCCLHAAVIENRKFKKEQKEA